jgi:hypothetical protein
MLRELLTKAAFPFPEGRRGSASLPLDAGGRVLRARQDVYSAAPAISP